LVEKQRASHQLTTTTTNTTTLSLRLKTLDQKCNDLQSSNQQTDHQNKALKTQLNEAQEKVKNLTGLPDRLQV